MLRCHCYIFSYFFILFRYPFLRLLDSAAKHGVCGSKRLFAPSKKSAFVRQRYSPNRAPANRGSSQVVKAVSMVYPRIGVARCRRRRWFPLVPFMFQREGPRRSPLRRCQRQRPLPVADASPVARCGFQRPMPPSPIASDAVAIGV